MDYLQAIALALLQGITEFLPISSSAHLILLPNLLGWQDQGLAFDVAVHVGTLFAVVLFLRQEIVRIVPAWFAGFHGFSWNDDGRIGWWVILATIPVGLVGLLADDWIETNLREPYIIALSTLFFGILLGVADRRGEQQGRSLAVMTLTHALLIIGIAQAFALIPGTSRSGITMTAALFIGYSRQDAAKFSFMLAVPVIALSGLFKGKQLVESAATVDWLLLLVAMAVAAATAFLCMRWFMRFIERIGMLPFVYYRILLALFIIIVFYV